jgi:hypothetical protein
MEVCFVRESGEAAFIYLFIVGIGVWTKGLLFARQVFHYFSHTLLFALVIFQIDSQVFAQALDHDPFTYGLTSR